MSCGICKSLQLPHATTFDHSLSHERWHDHYLLEILEAQAKWPLINLLEVSLRNRMAQQLEYRFGTDFFVSEPRQLLSGEINRLRIAQADSPVLERFEIIRKLPMGFGFNYCLKNMNRFSGHQPYGTLSRPGRAGVESQFMKR